MKFRNINSKFGKPEIFDTLPEMEEAIVACGYDLDEELEEGRDYEIVPEFRIGFDGMNFSGDNDEFPEWLQVSHVFAGKRFATMHECKEQAKWWNELAWEMHLEKIPASCREYYRNEKEEFAPMFIAEIC